MGFMMFYGAPDNIDACLLFLFQKDFYTFHKHIDAFCFSLLKKDFDTFCGPLFEVFLCFSDNI